MEISVELTLTPLKDDFKTIIKDFIISLRNSNLKIIETPLSTQVYGDYKQVMSCLDNNIYNTFLKSDNIILNIKIQSLKNDKALVVINKNEILEQYSVDLFPISNYICSLAKIIQ